MSFAVGYATSSFRTMLLTYGAGVVLAFVIAVPDWPYFNQHPQRWLKMDEDHPKWCDDGNGKKAEGGGASGVGNKSKNKKR